MNDAISMQSNILAFACSVERQKGLDVTVTLCEFKISYLTV